MHYTQTIQVKHLILLAQYSQSRWGDAFDCLIEPERTHMHAQRYPWGYQTDGRDIYEMLPTDTVTVYWEDERDAVQFTLQYGDRL